MHTSHRSTIIDRNGRQLVAPGWTSLAELDLTDALLGERNLVKASFKDATLKNADLYGAYLYGSDITLEQLRSSDLTGLHRDVSRWLLDLNRFEVETVWRLLATGDGREDLELKIPWGSLENQEWWCLQTWGRHVAKHPDPSSDIVARVIQDAVEAFMRTSAMWTQWLAEQIVAVMARRPSPQAASPQVQLNTVGGLRAFLTNLQKSLEGIPLETEVALQYPCDDMGTMARAVTAAVHYEVACLPLSERKTSLLTVRLD